jgi:hypothetical protein
MWPTHYIPNQPRVEGVPPPRYYLTTPPYPMEVYEDLQAGGGEFETGRTGTGTEESVTAYGEFLGGTMTTYGFPSYSYVEALTVYGEFLGGTLVERRVIVNAPPEMLTVYGEFLGGSMTDPLVRYENWPLSGEGEALECYGEFIGGTLT